MESRASIAGVTADDKRSQLTSLAERVASHSGLVYFCGRLSGDEYLFDGSQLSRAWALHVAVKPAEGADQTSYYKRNLRNAFSALRAVFSTPDYHGIDFSCLLLNGDAEASAQQMSNWDGVLNGLKTDQRGLEISMFVTWPKGMSGPDRQFSPDTWKALMLDVWKALLDNDVTGIGYVPWPKECSKVPADFGLLTPFSYSVAEGYSGLDPLAGVVIRREDLLEAGIPLSASTAILHERRAYLKVHQEQAGRVIEERCRQALVVKSSSTNIPPNPFATSELTIQQFHQANLLRSSLSSSSFVNEGNVKLIIDRSPDHAERLFHSLLLCEREAEKLRMYEGLQRVEAFLALIDLISDKAYWQSKTPLKNKVPEHVDLMQQKIAEKWREDLTVTTCENLYSQLATLLPEQVSQASWYGWVGSFMPSTRAVETDKLYALLRRDMAELVGLADFNELKQDRQAFWEARSSSRLAAVAK